MYMKENIYCLISALPEVFFFFSNISTHVCAEFMAVYDQGVSLAVMTLTPNNSHDVPAI